MTKDRRETRTADEVSVEPKVELGRAGLEDVRLDVDGLQIVLDGELDFDVAAHRDRRA